MMEGRLFPLAFSYIQGDRDGFVFFFKKNTDKFWENALVIFIVKLIIGHG